MKTFLCSLLLSSVLYAQWPATPEINLQVSRQNNVSVSQPYAVTDGNNGAIITWLDDRKGTTTLFAQRVNESGLLVWDSTRVEVSTDSATTFSYTMMPDGNGGIFVIWSRMADVWLDLYAQRINAAGQQVWSDTGIVVCNAAYSQVNPKLAPDDNGGFIACWADYRTSTYSDIFVSRIDENGNPLWNSNVSLSIPIGRKKMYPKLFQMVMAGRLSPGIHGFICLNLFMPKESTQMTACYGGRTGRGFQMVKSFHQSQS